MSRRPSTHKGSEIPHRLGFAPVLQQRMPQLLTLAPRYTPNKLSEAVQAELCERLVSLG